MLPDLMSLDFYCDIQNWRKNNMKARMHPALHLWYLLNATAHLSIVCPFMTAMYQNTKYKENNEENGKVFLKVGIKLPPITTTTHGAHVAKQTILLVCALIS